MQEIRKVHCIFEQSGVFKNEFKKLGYDAEDYDIQDEFGETDHIIDLFSEIRKAYDGEQSIFDTMKKDDLVMAFFPCVRFEVQIIMAFKGTQSQVINKDDVYKLEYDLKLHRQLSEMYELITKMTIVCKKHEIPLIIENPYSTQHYLTRYWCIEPEWIDYDRTLRGDYYKKPTQYWFIGCKPKHNFVMEPQELVPDHTSVADTPSHTERSLISPNYARKFIKEFIC